MGIIDEYNSLIRNLIISKIQFGIDPETAHREVMEIIAPAYCTELQKILRSTEKDKNLTVTLNKEGLKK